MSSKLTNKQQKFCEDYIQTRNLSKSALNAGYSESFSLKKSYQLLQDEKIIHKIEELEKEYYTNQFKKLERKAVAKLETILDGGENKDKLRAIEMIMKVNGFAQGISIEATTNDISIKVKMPDGI